jgi:poly(beta-D-mannuronate) lyase
MRRLLGRSMILLLLAASSALACGEKLQSPWDKLHITPTDAPYNCPKPPPFAKTIEIGSYYTDEHMSVIDPGKLAAFQQASAAPTQLSQAAALAADGWLATGSRAAARCVYSLLDAAAKEDAWAGQMPGFQGVYVQGWTLSGVGIAYLKVRPSGVGDASQDTDIARWLNQLASRVRVYFDAHIPQPGSDAWNNHMNWAGLAVAAAAVANNDAAGADWALKAYEMGVSAIQADGSLPAEMNRAGMALHYHLYALGPLVLLAEFGEANGGGLYAEHDGAIHRLVRFCTAALADPAILEKRTGGRQVISDPLSGTDIGWAVPYVRRFPNAQLSSLLAKAAWVRSSQWGGAPPD